MMEIIGCGVILLFLIGWAMEEPGSVLLFLASIGVTLLIGYIIMNVTILRIIVFSFFGLMLILKFIFFSCSYSC